MMIVHVAFALMGVPGTDLTVSRSFCRDRSNRGFRRVDRALIPDSRSAAPTPKDDIAPRRSWALELPDAPESSQHRS
jgi:hypothetical protein